MPKYKIVEAKQGAGVMLPSERQVLKAIKAMDQARDALEPLVMTERVDDAVSQLRSDLCRLSDHLEKATWWRKK